MDLDSFHSDPPDEPDDYFSHLGRKSMDEQIANAFQFRVSASKTYKRTLNIDKRGSPGQIKLRARMMNLYNGWCRNIARKELVFRRC